MKRVVSVLIAFIVLTAAGLVFWDGMSPGDAPLESTHAVQAVTVEKPQLRDLRETIRFHGTLEARATVPIVPKASGTVDSVYGSVGDPVEKDQLIAVMEADEVRLQLQQVEAAVKAAEANLARASSGARPEEIEQAEAALRQAESNFESAQSQYERSSRLHDEGVMSRSEWEGAKNQFEVAQAQLRSAQQSLELSLSGAHPEDIRAAEAAVEEARAARELAALALENTRIKANRSGIINQLDAEAGMTVGAGEPIGFISDMSVLRMSVNAGSRTVARLQRGQVVILELEGAADEVMLGEIVTVAPAADPASGMFPVRIEFPGNDQRARPGMYGTADVVVKDLEQVLTIPYRAVADAQQQPHVFAVEEGRVSKVPVELGLRQGAYIEVLAGLEESMVVVTAGRDGLGDGSPVEIIDDGEVLR